MPEKQNLLMPILPLQVKGAKQIEVYKTCFDLFKKFKENISSVTFWNISDRHSWLDNFPVRGRKDYPAL
jgi:endo-1,4-beta-xylanase